jgi:hypothetical protein
VPELEESLVTCANCEQQIRETEADDAGWRYRSDGVGELHAFCDELRTPGFPADAPASADSLDGK